MDITERIPLLLEGITFPPQYADDLNTLKDIAESKLQILLDSSRASEHAEVCSEVVRNFTKFAGRILDPIEERKPGRIEMKTNGRYKPFDFECPMGYALSEWESTYYKGDR